MPEYVFKPEGGLGNTLIQLTSLDKNNTKLHKSIKDYEFSNCIVINGFDIVDYDGIQPNIAIYINNNTVRHVHPKIRDIIKPTPFMEKMIQDNLHLLEGVCCGMSIRRGSYSADSRQYKDARSDQPAFYHCSDNGLEKFKNIIKCAPGKIFLSSDSASTVKILTEEYGEKIVNIDQKFVVSMSQDSDEKIRSENYHNMFLKFFLFSMCPQLFLTGGNTDMVGFSTYAYIAAIYGNKQFNIVFNND
jgi:hypothetical protein